ncbi:Asp-tRNA(Asn)/Glu-tRNA(Gln) amidotransferase subunit GatC [Aggregicoccus sp. 17bor-14]|uniref:Asp-tRNA(Asn)/Glu-tRNA(Gln) amidotransferase subunit GatC n=1 Tax=Myxococcaceae TaxID=31 RepID=UPI00129C915D|nr:MULTISPECIES: Asp-tRNA(Asn)/Glu-tRNA(Gln) amidotransferase subunit GatC [Myxococcaceae]MBF5043732.1 Asp-tRNA(Asn)/Glu-tRNA(Gln) amidotransferase subunit GatC [Simulacricoccus sp. 17bor-14]MRI89488.1 Asp-tRNA(Asn)/Glu-tRNA(Gln) amidotransferase subunit GatC [Aggregicoccus sp. 17bor-14]
MRLTLEQVRHVARLARLALTPGEEEAYREQLSAILEAAEQLQGLDVSGVEPTSHAGLAASLAGAVPAPPLREDAVRPSLPPEAALANAPERSGTRFCVPRVLE